MWLTPWRLIPLFCWSSSALWCSSSRSSDVSGRCVTPSACWRWYVGSLVFILFWLTLAVCSDQLLFVPQFLGLLVAILLLQIAAAFVGYFFTDTVTGHRKIVLNWRSKQTNMTVLLLFRWWREPRGWWWRQLNDTGRTKTWRTPLTSSRRRWRRVLRLSNLFCSFFFTVVMTVLLLHCDCSSSAVELKAIKTGPVTPTLSVRTPTRVWRPVEFPSPAAFACRTRSEPVSEPGLDMFGCDDSGVPRLFHSLLK